MMRASGVGGVFDYAYVDAFGTSGDPAPDRMAAVANAIHSATGLRFDVLPMSPPKVLKAMDEKG